MKKRILPLCVAMPFILLACGGDDLPEDYTVPEPRILAVRIEDPEVSPGGRVAMRMLMAGKRIDQAMTVPVEWFLETDPPVFLGAAPYAEDFFVQIPEDTLSEGEDQADIHIMAKIMIGNKSHFASKQTRITHDPVAKNPVITEIGVRYKVGNETVRDFVGEGDVISVTDQTGAVAFTGHTAELARGENDQLVHRWYASDAKHGEGRLYAYEDADVTGELFGQFATVGEGEMSVIFSLRGEENDGNTESGIYDVYLVVRDNAADSHSSEEDRFGTDFIWFTLCVNTDC